MLRNAYLLFPVLASLVAVISAALPWGAPMSVALALPLVAMGVIFYWGIHRPAQLPSPVVFVFGLLTDLATDGPLGFWALSFLVGYAIAVYGPAVNGGRREGPAALMLYAAAILAITGLNWSLTSLFFLKPMPLQPLLIGGAVALAVYPAIGFVLSPLERAVGLALQRLSTPQDDWL
jgi:rod shape-determining protein MreD